MWFTDKLLLGVTLPAFSKQNCPVQKVNSRMSLPDIQAATSEYMPDSNNSNSTFYTITFLIV